jgi:cytochrome c oxidase cbb3-type subunit 3
VGAPNLTDNYWIYGGDIGTIVTTVHGGREGHMPTWDERLTKAQIKILATYVYSLSHPAYSTPERIDAINAGQQVFLTTCAACHGENAKGNQEVGAPNLTDNFWIYGGDIGTIVTTVHGGREGHMPTWDERLTKAQIKILATYVYSLGLENP